MKRIAAALFLLFYLGSVIGLTLERTETWAAEFAYTLKHHRVNQAAGLSEARKHPPHQINGKLFEDHSVLISSTVRSYLPPDFQAPVHRLEGFAAGRTSRTIAPRAPPSLL